MRTYDHEEDKQSVLEDEQGAGEAQEKLAQLRGFEEDYNLSKITAELNEANFHLKAHESVLRKVQRDIEGKVGQAQLTEALALISAGIHADPNIVKLLKTREGANEGEEDKVRAGAGALSRKLNQMGEALSLLLAGQKRLEGKIAAVQGQLGMQLGEKVNSLQLQMEEARGESSKVAMELSQRMELTTFELSDKMREMDTKLNWRLSEFKGKIEEKINEEMVLIYLEGIEKKMEKRMQEFQIHSNIDPLRLQRIEQQLADNRSAADSQITHANYLIHSIQTQIDTQLVRLQEYSANKVGIEQRLSLFNDNFMDVYRRVIATENGQTAMQSELAQLLTNSSYSLTELKRINTVLLNIKLSDEFQRMLEEMNPAKVLLLQSSVDAVQSEQTAIFREMGLLKREISIINAKSENMGFLTPNHEREKLKKEEIQEALHNFLTDHHFAQKIANLDRQLADYKNSMDSVALLSRQLARFQKESDSHHLALEMHSLEEYVKRQLAALNSRFRDKHTFPLPQRPPTNRSSVHEDTLAEGSLARSFSTKKVTPLNLSRQQQAGKHLIEIKTSRR